MDRPPFQSPDLAVPPPGKSRGNGEGLAKDGLRVGEWTVEPALNELRSAGRVVKVEPKAMEVLVYLAARPGQVVGREELLAAVWRGVVVGDDALTQVVIKLRKALGEAYIQTIPKRGYRLVLPAAAPGVLAARYAGEKASYADNCRKLLRDMNGVAEGRRGARFRTVMALALAPADAERLADAKRPEVPPGGVDCLLADGVLPGEIALAPRGTHGFGYDPVFVDVASRKTLAEMTIAEKNRTSHRYRALVEMREMLLRVDLAREK